MVRQKLVIDTVADYLKKIMRDCQAGKLGVNWVGIVL